MPPALDRTVVHGIPVVTIHDRSLPLARFLIGLRRGAGDDPIGRSGAMHALLELMLRGTAKRDRREFSDTLEVMGSGAYCSIGHEAAWIRGSCLTRHLDETFALVSEAILSVGLIEDELRRLLEETIESERSARDDDESVVRTFMRRALWRDHPFHRSPYGEVPEVAQLTRKTLQAAYAAQWVRQNIVFGFAGDISPNDAARLAEPLIAALPEGEMSPPSGRPEPGSGLRIIVVDKPERTQVQMRLGRLTCGGNDELAWPLWLGAMAFGGTFTSPFTHEVREVRGWSYDAHASFDRRTRQPSSLELHSAPALADAIDCLQLELEMYRGLAGGDLSDEIIDGTRNYLHNRYPFNIATAADMLVPAIRNELIDVAPDSLLQFPQRLDAISNDSVRAALRRYLDPDSLTAVLVATADDVRDDLQRGFPEAAIDIVDYRKGLS